MKKVLFKVAAVMLLTFMAQGVFAQDYCLWVVNHRPETLYGIHVKTTAARAFGNDLLPNDHVESGKAYWIRVTNWRDKLGDVKITAADSYGNISPLMFNVASVSGQLRNYDYIRLNFQDIHTLVLNANGTFSIYNNDALGLGHPCGN